MHIVFQQDKDGYKKNQTCYVERSLARRFCDNGIAITYQRHLDNIFDAKQVKKAELLKKRDKKPDKAISKKATKRSKAVKF